ncbi:hypothetical protein AVEN_123139-1 [Araneus ventricosus]|uniref:Reverse transcriptase domain-containing protein n=1 Tax=Araneus ventricosus TaxID=182803 RepID=A0A4Y2EZD1_ARAVE|nr:hypothetical protein AVEN_123139-1 [Araneus ventricosus]
MLEAFGIKDNGAGHFSQNLIFFALQETFLKPSDNFYIPNKVIYRQDRSSNSGRGGLLIGVNSKFSSKCIQLQMPNSNIEVQAVYIKIQQLSFTIIDIYSPTGCFTTDWLNCLINQISSPYIIVGDFNIKHPALGASHTSQSSEVFLNWILENNLNLINTCIPTHLTSSSSSLLDLSIIRSDIYPYITFSVLSDPYGSDHLPIQIFFNTKKSSFIVKKKTNWVEIQNHLHQHKISEDEFQSYNDFESFCKNTIFSFSSSYKVHSQANAPWWNSQCSFLLGQKRKYLRLVRTYLSQPFWIQYKKLSARLNNLISKRQRQYWNNTCENAGYSGKIYKIIRAIYNRNHHPIENANFIKISNALISDPNTQANLFASHYEQNPIEEFIPFDLSSNEDNYYNNSFSVDEFDYVLQKTPNTSPVRDGITANLIKNLPTSFKSTLLSIYNEIWSTGEIPSEWQIAKILPILKPGRDSKNIQSYRPISLTSVVCKIFERLILNRFINTGIHRDFHPHHAGFLPQKDCNYIHSLVHHKIIQAKNDKKYFILIKLDIASAYDSV